eukprot:SAG22_NODE_2462_length_2544_cov_1.131288_2_plen_111_part_00
MAIPLRVVAIKSARLPDETYRVEIPADCSVSAVLCRLHRVRPELGGGIGIVHATEMGWAALLDCGSPGLCALPDDAQPVWVIYEDAGLDKLPALEPAAQQNVAKLARAHE